MRGVGDDLNSESDHPKEQSDVVLSIERRIVLGVVQAVHWDRDYEYPQRLDTALC